MTFSKTETLKAKGIAILLLLFHHLFYSVEHIRVSGVICRIIDENTLLIIANNARVCVWIFVFLSAYGLSVKFKQSLNQPEVFLWNQTVKLLVPYQFVLLLTWIICQLFCPEKGLYVFCKENGLLNLFTDFLQ